MHDIPCYDITLAGTNYTSEDATKTGRGTVRTGGYLPYGSPSAAGLLVRGRVPCTGAIMRMPLAGGQPEVVVWGLRDPYGLSLAPDGRIYATERSYQVRGSRPVWGAGDLLWEIRQGAWYGFPDFAGGVRMADNKDYKAPGRKMVQPILQNAPGTPPKPVAVLAVQAAASGLDFSSSPAFGHVGDAFIAETGDLAPVAGKVLQPMGFKVTRVNVATGLVEEFAVNRARKNGPASFHRSGGLERPISVRFDPSGKAMYVVDFGILKMSKAGPQDIPGTGVVWKITKK